MMRQWFYVGILMAAGSMASAATTFSWKANTTGDWFTAANWTNASGWPSDGDTVIITNVGASVILSNTTASLTGLTLGGTTAGQRTLTFTNWDTCLYASNLTVLTNGYITCAGPFTNNAMSNRVNLICSNLAIEGGGAINVNGKGYSGGTNTSVAWVFGNGPGGGGWWGASHGGAGREYANGPPGNLKSLLVYGSPTAPLDPGSGGQAGYDVGMWAGPGGGAVCITATQVVVSGSISADATPGSGVHGSGGAGGSIFITCATITGTNGTITAIGGMSDGGNNGGGGGGRIAVLYAPAAQTNMPVPTIRFSTASGLGNFLQTMADPGTLYFPDNYFLSPTNIFTGQWLVDGFTNWSVSDLVVSNAWIRLPGAGFRLTVTNTLTVISTDYTTGYLRYKLDLTNAAAVSCGQCLLNGGALTLNCPLSIAYIGSYDMVLTTNNAVMTGVTMNCPGNLTLTNAGRLYVAGGVTNADVASTSFGAWINVGGDILVTSNAWIYPAAHPTNGTAVLLSMRNLTIDRYGGINSDNLGYSHHNGPGLPPDTDPTYHHSSGAGYGGEGAPGWRTTTIWGPTYGSSNAPLDPGSGGRGSQEAPATDGPAGGGSVQIRAVKTVAIQGTISANGGGGFYSDGGGASGGGIYITCRTFIGNSNGVLRANGGAGYNQITYGGGGGGGGRVAVWRIFDQSTSVISNYVNGGSGWTNTVSGTNGTIVWGWLPPAGTIFRIY